MVIRLWTDELPLRSIAEPTQKLPLPSEANTSGSMMRIFEAPALSPRSLDESDRGSSRRARDARSVPLSLLRRGPMRPTREAPRRFREDGGVRGGRLHCLCDYWAMVTSTSTPGSIDIDVCARTVREPCGPEAEAGKGRSARFA